MKNFFAYGTLMSVEVMREISGCRISPIPGMLRGYRRFGVKAAYYPAIIPCSNSFVEGAIYQNLPDSAWKLLDAFEGDVYARKTVNIEFRGTRNIFADAYVLKPEYQHCLEADDWDFIDFMKKYKSKEIQF